MKIIVAGTRDILKYITPLSLKTAVVEAMKPLDLATEIVSGMSGDVDREGVRYAKAHNLPVAPFPYKSELGKAGGPVRNREMAEYGDALVLVWDGRSRGSSSMLSEARRAGLPIVQVVYHRTLKREGLDGV